MRSSFDGSVDGMIDDLQALFDDVDEDRSPEFYLLSRKISLTPRTPLLALWRPVRVQDNHFRKRPPKQFALDNLRTYFELHTRGDGWEFIDDRTKGNTTLLTLSKECLQEPSGQSFFEKNPIYVHYCITPRFHYFDEE